MALHKGFGQIQEHDQVPYMRTTNGPTNLRDQAAQPYVKTKDAQILVNDGLNDRVVIGQRGDGSFGIKVSKPGFSASTGTSDQQVMSSDFNIFKIVATGTQSITKGASSPGTTIAFAHGLGYRPVIIAFADFTGASPAIQHLPANYVNLSNGLIDLTIQASVDATNVNFAYFSPSTSAYFGSALTTTIRWYLMVETAN